MIDPNIVYHPTPFPDVIGAEAHKQFVASTLTAYPDTRIVFEDLIVEGNLSSFRWTFTGTFNGPLPGLPITPTGKTGIALGAHIVRWKDGKVVEAWHIGDWLGLLTQQGVIPPMG